VAQYIARRLLLMIPTLLAISVISFLIIQLPPGDFLTSYLATLAESGQVGGTTADALQALRAQYGLDQPVYVQYLKWLGRLLQGDFGYSMEWKRPVWDLLWERLALTFVLSLATLLFTWIIAFPIGILSAVRQYSFWDYVASFFGFLGLATPDFLFALVLMWVAFAYFGQSVGGLFSPEFIEAPWSPAKVGDMVTHLWIPMLVLGTHGTAGLIRVMRANLLDELHKPYVETARAKGLPEMRALMKYPVRAALNPFVSTVGWYLPGLVSGSVIVAVVLNLPITGPLLLRALLSKDMYMAGSFIFMLSVLTVVGTLISDVLLAWLDPRIRFGEG
jgi:peptide/nickel transport system permease protein